MKNSENNWLYGACFFLLVSCFILNDSEPAQAQRAGFFGDIIDSIAEDMLGALQAWFCWLLNAITTGFVDVIIKFIGYLPKNAMDVATLQSYIDLLWVFNEALPVVEYATMFAVYYLFVMTWTAFNWLIHLIPTVG